MAILCWAAKNSLRGTLRDVTDVEFFRGSNDFIVQKVYLLRLMPACVCLIMVSCLFLLGPLITSCAADFSLLNLPKGKSLGRSKPATNS
jgi:hypothetical protein